MVLDSLKNAKAAYCLHPRFQQAFEYLMKTDLSKVDPQKIVLDGDDLFISLVEMDGKTPDAAKMETHNAYIDIQYVISGTEQMGWAAIEECKNATDPYDAAKDITFFTDKPSFYCTVKPGQFAIFFPEDGHAPGISTGKIKKAIVKIKVK